MSGMTLRLAALVAAISLAGCYDSVVPTDAPARDSGPIARDAGPITRDAFVPPRDAFVPPPVDAGGDVCVVGERLDPYEGPRCRPETVECLESCEADPDPEFCQDDCFGADEVCIQCINETIVRCAANNGCQAEWDAYACCSEERCPGFEEADRLACGDPCGMPLDPFIECLNFRAIDECEPRIYDCLMP